MFEVKFWANSSVRLKLSETESFQWQKLVTAYWESTKKYTSRRKRRNQGSQLFWIKKVRLRGVVRIYRILKSVRYIWSISSNNLRICSSTTAWPLMTLAEELYFIILLILLEKDKRINGQLTSVLYSSSPLSSVVNRLEYMNGLEYMNRLR